MTRYTHLIDWNNSDSYDAGECMRYHLANIIYEPPQQQQQKNVDKFKN